MLLANACQLHNVPGRKTDMADCQWLQRLAQLVYRVLRYGMDYVDEGQAAYEARFRHNRLAGIEKAAKEMGYALVAQPTGG